MDWEGSSSPPLRSSAFVSSPQSCEQQRSSPQRSPSLLSSSSTSLAMLPPPPNNTPASVGVGATSRARVSSPSSLSPQTSQQSHHQSASSIIRSSCISTENNSVCDATFSTSSKVNAPTSERSNSSSPLELTGPRSKHHHHHQHQLQNNEREGSSTSPTRTSSTSPSAQSHSYSRLSGPQSPVVLISSSSVAGRLQLDRHHHHHHHLHHPAQIHSQTYRNHHPSSISTTSTTTIVSRAIDTVNSCGAVDLVASNKTTARIQDQPEERVAVVVATPQTSSSLSPSTSSISGQQQPHQKHHQLNLGVPPSSSSSPFVSSFPSSPSTPVLSSSSLNLRRTSRHDEEALEEETEDKEQRHPTDLSNPTKTTTTSSQQHQKNSRNYNHQEECGGGGVGDQQQHSHHQQKQTSPSSHNHQVPSLSIRKNKPIPPPLDLSIGAANLSLHHSHQQTQHSVISAGTTNTTTTNSSSSSASNNHNHSNNNSVNHSSAQQIHNPQQPSSPIYLGSPKFADNKNLPIRKRYQHLSPPTQMNGQENTEGAVVAAAATSSAAVTPSSSGPGSAGIYSRNWGLDMVPLSAPPITSSNRSNNHHHHHGISLASTNTVNGTTNSTNNIPNSIGLHTPTPFYTPNEQSPKFMNSPVFSYSNPDTSLYQGPFSPIRASSLYPPPSSPFTHLSLNSPLPPLQSSVSSNSSTSSSNSSSNGGNSGGATPSSAGGGGGGGMVGNPCFNMIPSTLLSPAPSQASTNSLSYEDLHEKSLSLFSPAWSIFLPGTKIRFVGGMNSMDWYMADFLAQSGDSLLAGLKGEYAPHGLECRKLVMTSSPKERVQLTFCPVAESNHPTIEVNCEPGHPFWVDKKGWCAVKPEVFQETYGTPCQKLEGGDICTNAARSPNNNIISMNNNNPAFLHHHHQQQQQQQQQHSVVHLTHHNNGFNNSMMHHTSPANVNSSVANGNLINNNNIITSNGVSLVNMHNISHIHAVNNSMNTNGLINQPINSLLQSPNHSVVNLDVKMESDIKPFLMTSSPQNHHNAVPMQIMQSPPPPPIQHSQPNNQHPHQRSAGGSGNGNSRKTFASVQMSAPASPAKRSKDSQSGDQPVKGRRPMNAFLLFAKDKRPELIQKFPGKDNRTISVLLGEAWQKLAAPERERYASNAKARAEEQKRIHPDCWKRKRSQSTSS